LGEDSKDDILNACDYGLPQRRKRIFAISFLEKKYKFTSNETFKNNFLNLIKDKKSKKYSISE
jgi:site-specific DNA-cytosine methylase